MKNNLRKTILCIVLLLSLEGCIKSNESIKKRDDLYVSFTVTHAAKEDKESFESDVYYFDLYEKKVNKVASVPYTSQYPLTIYDESDKVIYYSGKEKDKTLKKDELFQYDIDAKKIKKLTSSLYAINYLFLNNRGIILGAIGDDNDKSLGPKIFDKKNGKLKSLKWKDDDFIDIMTYNPEIETTVFSSSSLKEQYEKMDKSNKNGTPLEGVNNKVYILRGEEYKLEFEVNDSYMKNIVINNSAIYYQCSGAELSQNDGLKRYDLKTKKTTQLDSVIGSGEMFYISENGEDIYYVNKNQLSKLNVKTMQEEIIYSVDITKEAINNAQIIKKK